MLGRMRKESSPERRTLSSMGAVRMDGSGKLSVSLKDLAQTDRYQEDLATLRRIAAMARERGGTLR